MRIGAAVDVGTTLALSHTHIFNTAQGGAFRWFAAFHEGIAYRIVASVDVACACAIAAQRTVVVAVEFARIADFDGFTCIDIVFECVALVAVIHACAVFAGACCIGHSAFGAAAAAVEYIRFQIVAQAAAIRIAIIAFTRECIGVAFLM